MIRWPFVTRRAYEVALLERDIRIALLLNRLEGQAAIAYRTALRNLDNEPSQVMLINASNRMVS